jgi:hypothetical protein
MVGGQSVDHACGCSPGPGSASDLHAEGDLDIIRALAQFILGLLELLGCLTSCVPKSRAERSVWVEFAASELQTWSRETAASGRYEAVTMLSPEELSGAQQRAAEWFSTHPPE